MNGTQPLQAPSPHRDGDVTVSLDDRIWAVEQRMMARERALSLQVNELSQRLRRATQARRMLPPAAGIAAAVAVLWWVWRGRASRFASAAVPAQSAQARADVPWAHWLALAWPLLPARWRARVSPATAATLMSVGLPMMSRLLAHPVYPPLTTTPLVDLARYAGTWYEIARLPTPFEAACAGQPSAHYAQFGDGLRVRNECPQRGARRVARGVARIVPGSGNAKLKVSFWPAWLRWLPAAWSDYWVLHVDSDYSVALVGHPDRRHLWLLSRRRRIDDRQFADLVRLGADRGFAVDRLQIAQP